MVLGLANVEPVLKLFCCEWLYRTLTTVELTAEVVPSEDCGSVSTLVYKWALLTVGDEVREGVYTSCEHWQVLQYTMIYLQ